MKPTCSAGHGPMTRVSGTFALQGGEVKTIGTAGLLDQVAAQQFITNGQMFSLQIWRCDTCQRIELFDEEASDVG